MIKNFLIHVEMMFFIILIGLLSPIAILLAEIDLRKKR